MRRVAILLTTRGNYAKMKSTMRAIRARDDLRLVTLVGGGIIQERFGDYRPAILRDGFAIDASVDFLEGDAATLESQTRSAGRAVSEIGRQLGAFAPDILLVIADRWEALSAAFAALSMNISIAHLEGGEVSGSIDERIRHAITKLAHLHLPANHAAADRIARMGEERQRIVVVGTPSLDLLSEIDLSDRARLADAPGGEGDPIDFTKDFIVVSQHPVVTENEDAGRQIVETAAAVRNQGLPIIWILPNMDAGGEGVMTAIRDIRRGGLGVPVRFYSAMGFQDYSILLAHTRCLVGNSSSGLREGAFLGTPVVNIGTRQTGRDRGANVIDVAVDRGRIVAAIARQLAHGRYPSDPLYGDGRAGEKIASALAAMPLTLDKTIAY
ncbi:MAG: UDP-N-acetylglucosamine 2-epimerase [Pseudorhodoplanes sp.]